MKEQLEAALSAKDAEIERLSHKIGLLEDLCKYFRDAVGECHVMISRDTSEYQIRHEWEPTDLPPRMQRVMQRAEAAEAALTARDAEIATLREQNADAEYWMSEEFNAAWQAEMITLREQRIAALERAEIAERALDAARGNTAGGDSGDSRQER
jgi:hypothetical protein